ncbi:hypothetical protein [Streptomyces sp. NBC_00519]|uniref:hypothetical protein n=1 Tax=Streptomyces sp. NBC_00519 TaxID=2975764 RepID=UPI0030E03878
MAVAQSFETFKGEIERALSACGVDPHEWCDVNAAASYLTEDQHTNAPDDFWTVVRRYRRTPEREARSTAWCSSMTSNWS